LIATFNRLSDVEVGKIARAVVDARQVWVVGYRSSRSFASYFRWQIIQVVERVHLIPGGGETLAENLASMTDSDILIVFAVRRRTTQVARIIEYANKTGMKVLYVCDQQFSDGVKADWLIRCDASAPGPLDNHVAVVAVADLLITNIFQAAGAAGRKRLIAIEAAHDVTREL
jgi:DNA-binding MurR/RpiR family transcriptional regulator